MHLTVEEQAALNGEQGPATRKAMEILVALGKIYGAERMLPVTSVQVAGVSYDNLGEAGLEWLEQIANDGGRARILATLNPAGMDIERWQELGITQDYAEKQMRVIAAFSRMNIMPVCTCTPYLVGNLPVIGQHIAWAESSAVCFANSILGARTNREGGPSALAAALTGCTPAYGLHLDEQRQPDVSFTVEAGPDQEISFSRTAWFGALGKAIGEKLGVDLPRRIPYIKGIERASLEELKSFCASLATYGGVALFHMEKITPEAALITPSEISFLITTDDISLAFHALNQATPEEVDFTSLGCPHLSLTEIAYVADLLAGRRVRHTFWITTARPTKQIADQAGYTRIIEASGARLVSDTCCVVAPIKNRFTALATDSAKSCYYAASKNRFKTRFLSIEDAVEEASVAERQEPSV